MATLKDKTGEIILTFALLRKSHPEATDEWDRQWMDYELDIRFDRFFRLATQKSRAIPLSEVESLLIELKEIVKGDRSEIDFEPMEPDFRIQVAPLFDDEEAKSYQFEIWIDKDNFDSSGYGASYIGVKFFTTKEEVENFIKQSTEEITQLGIEPE